MPPSSVLRFAPYRRHPRAGSTVLPIPAAPATPNMPYPADTATALYSRLSWVSAGATKFDIYFGTNPSPSFLIPSYVGTTYIPTLAPFTTYYWKIVAINDGGTATGPVWSFTTLAASKVLFLLDGVLMTSRVRFPSGLSIHDVLGAAPNTASALFDTVAPTAGQSITIGLGLLDSANLLFGGEIQSVDRSYEVKPDNLVWPASLIDHTFAINKRRPLGTFVNQSATMIAQYLIATFAPGFTSRHVQLDLPAISINFDGESDFMSCMNQLAIAVGGRTKVDYSRDVHLFIAEATDAPDPINEFHPPMNTPPLTFSTDLSQIRSRAYGKGHGETIPTDVAERETILPIPDVSMFNPLGGQIIAGSTADGAQTDIYSYTGVQFGSGGSLVGPGASPSTAPSLALAAGAGLATGLFQYAYTDVTGSGESLPSPVASITTGNTAAPGSAPAAGTPTEGTGPDIGSHDYAVTFVTASGETTAGPTVTKATSTTTAPSSAPTAGTPTIGDVGVDNGTHDYQVTFVTAIGETTVSPTSGSVTAREVSAPPAFTFEATTGPGPSNVTANTDYHYVATYLDGGTPGSSHETLQGPTSLLHSTSDPSTNEFIFTVTASGDAAVTNIGIYRQAGTGAFKLLVVLSNTTQEYRDKTFSDADIAGHVSPPGSSTFKYQTIGLTTISTGASNVTQRKLYRRFNGTGTFKLVTTIANNTATTYTDTTTNASLGAAAPSTNTAYLQRIPLSAIPTGPASVTQRKIYRTTAGGAQLKLLTTLADNTTTTFNDTVTDASLGANVPTTNTATANQVSLTGIAIGASGTTQRKVYRTAVNASQLKLLTTLADNTTTTYLDVNADASLGANAPVSDTSGLTQPQGQVLAGSTSILLASAGPFSVNGGWASLSSLTVRYTGISGNTLTGIPPNGFGALTTTVLYGNQIFPSPALTGLNNSNGLRRAIAKGSLVHLWVQRDDLAAQAALGQLEKEPNGNPTDGIREFTITDDRRGEASLIALCDADLARFSRPIVSVTYCTRDPKTRAGKTVHINTTTGIFDSDEFGNMFNVVGTWGLEGDFLIQDVTITFDAAPDLLPHYQVTASSAVFSLSDLLRRVLVTA
jgi:hypothetical protein